MMDEKLEMAAIRMIYKRLGDSEFTIRQLFDNVLDVNRRRHVKTVTDWFLHLVYRTKPKTRHISSLIGRSDRLTHAMRAYYIVKPVNINGVNMQLCMSGKKGKNYANLWHIVPVASDTVITPMASQEKAAPLPDPTKENLLTNNAITSGARSSRSEWKEESAKILAAERVKYVSNRIKGMFCVDSKDSAAAGEECLMEEFREDGLCLHTCPVKQAIATLNKPVMI